MSYKGSNYGYKYPHSLIRSVGVCKKRKPNFILLAPTKIRIGCTSIQALDHGMKQNLVGVSYIH